MEPIPRERLFGHIAVQLGFLTRERLELALRLQQASHPPLPLGTLLLNDGALSLRQVQRVLEEQEARGVPPGGAAADTETVQAPNPRETRFGKTLLRERLATEAQVEEALRLQEKFAHRGVQVRLGEILVDKGYLSPEAVLRALALQNKRIMRCSKCGSRFNVWAMPGEREATASAPTAAAGAGTGEPPAPPRGRQASRPGDRAGAPVDVGAAVRRSVLRTPRLPRLPHCPDCGLTLEPDDMVAGVAVEETVEVVVEAEGDGGPGVAIARVRLSAEARGSELLFTLACFEAFHGDPERRSFGPYEVLGEIEEGGMSIVCKARDPGTGRPLALKVLGASRPAPPEARARFEEEGRTLARLRHPSIVAVQGMGVHAGRPYLVMEYVEGARLDRVIRARRRLEARLAASWLLELADAVAYCHRLGIVHRDLKPGNVLLRRPAPATAKRAGSTGRDPEVDDNHDARAADALGEAEAVAPVAEAGFAGEDPVALARWRPVLMDFGVASSCVPGSSHAPGSAGEEIAGTPCYMAPEQAAGDPTATNPLVDVYALGSVLYEMLTGLPPFAGDTPAQVLAAVLRGDPFAPSALEPSVDPRAEAICLHAMARAPADRYPSATALHEELAAFLSAS